jgi:hypothetical protein
LVRIVGWPERSTESRSDRQAYEKDPSAHLFVRGAAASNVTALKVRTVADGQNVGLSRPYARQRRVIDHGFPGIESRTVEHAEMSAKLETSAHGPAHSRTPTVNLHRTDNSEHHRFATPVVNEESIPRRSTDESGGDF